MKLGNSRVLLLGFTIAVMLCQNIALGMCHQSNKIFLDNCPCAEGEQSCPCQCPLDCTTFLELELDSYAKSEDFAGERKVEIAAPSSAWEWVDCCEDGHDSRSLSPVDSSNRSPSVYGRTMLSRYCVARV